MNMEATEPQDLFAEKEIVHLQLGAAQNISQEALKDLDEKLEGLRSFLEEQKKLVPMFNQIQEDTLLTKEAVTHILDENKLFDERLEKQEKQQCLVSQRLAQQEKSLEAYKGILGLVENITKTLQTPDARQEEIATTVDSLKKNDAESRETLLKNNAAWEKSFTTLQNFVTKELSAEKFRISQEILDLAIRVTQLETQTEKISALQKADNPILTRENLQNNQIRETFEKLEKKLTHLERQHTIFKWIGGGALALVFAFCCWFYTHNTSLSQI